MNVITFDTAYSLYPYATFESRSSLVLTKDTSDRTKSALEKYASRGFRMLESKILAETEKHDPTAFVIDLQRWVADGHSWVIPLSTDGLARVRDTASIADRRWQFKKRYHNSNEYIVDYIGLPRPRSSADDDCCCPACCQWADGYCEQ